MKINIIPVFITGYYTSILGT